MRKLICVLIGVAVMSAAASDAGAQDVSWGLKGGAVFGSLDVQGPDAFDTSADAGGVVGGFMGIGIGRHLRLQPEVYWSVRRFSATGVPAPFEVSSRGVEAPVLLQGRFPAARATQVLLYAGPQFAFVGKVTQAIGGRSTDISQQISDYDLGLVLGTGVEHRVARGAWLVELRTVLGTRNLLEQGEGSFRSRAIQVLFGWRF